MVLGYFISNSLIVESLTPLPFITQPAAAKYSNTISKGSFPLQFP